ncbi:MAG: signal transduction protein [Deltaproteobacteria bacterium]|nr:MAG: signal transduction protein [Deltaproteobacteria bacterium]
MKTAREFIDKFHNTRTLPNVVSELSRLMSDPNSTAEDFEDVMKMDPTLVAKLLQMVNSPFYGLSQEVRSISRAIVFVGMKNLHSLAVTDALKNLFKDSGDGSSFSRKRLWFHSAAVSICAKMLAERIFAVNGEDACLCGILHDFGIIVEEQIDHENFIKACNECRPDGSLTETEAQYLGTNHCKIGYLLAQDWHMQPELQKAILNHHNYQDEVDPSSLRGILQISEYIINKMKYTVLENTIPAIPASLAAHMEENIDEYKILIDDLPKEIEKAKVIYEN